VKFSAAIGKLPRGDEFRQETAMSARLRHFAFVLVMIFGIPALIALPFLLAGFLGLR
jgi:hypothetical protein